MVGLLAVAYGVDTCCWLQLLFSQRTTSHALVFPVAVSYQDRRPDSVLFFVSGVSYPCDTMSGTGSQSQIHANPSADDSCSEDASKIHASVEFMPDSEEEVCIPQMTVNIPLSTFGMSPANRSGQRTDPARTERLLRSVQQTVQFSNIDEKPMMVIQAAATYSIARKGERSKHWAKESHGKTRERQTVQTLATYPTDAESRKPGYVVITGNHPLLSTQALVSASDTDESDTDIVNMKFKYTRAQARNVAKHFVLRLWQQ